jgi:hypothetical protein
MGLCAPSEFSELQAAARPPRPSRAGQDIAAPPMRFFAPSASLRTWQQPLWTGLPHPTACVLRFSQPLDALIRQAPTGLVSCRIRSWGCALQSLAPLAQPYAVSGASCPLDVGAHPSNEPAGTPAPNRRSGSVRWSTTSWPRGSVPACRALLRVRVRLARSCGLGGIVARSSPGLRTLQGSLPRCGAPAFTGAPLMGLLPWDANGPRPGPSGSRPQRDRLVSLETTDPPGLLRLLDITNVRVGRGSGVASSGPGVRRRPLSNPL